MNNALNLNILIRGQPVDLVRDALVDVLRNVLISGDMLEATDDEPAERTIIVAHLENGPWLTIFDDSPPPEIEALALEVSERIGSPLVLFVVHDNQTLHLGLFRGGKRIDELSRGVFDEEPARPVPSDITLWQRLLEPNADPKSIESALASETDSKGPLDELADVLELRPQRWVEIADINEDEHRDLVQLRFISARKRARHRAAARKPKKATASSSVPPRPEPLPSAKAIPELLIGKPAEVKRRLKPIIKKAIATMDWSAALAGVDHTLIDDISASILTSPPNPYETGDPLSGERMLLYLIDEVLSDCAMSNEQRRELLLQGMDRPWFCLAAVACCAMPDHGMPFNEKRNLALAALRKVLRWWPDLCRWGPMLDSGTSRAREKVGWDSWQIPVLRWCQDLGYDWEREVLPMREFDSEEALNQIIDWVADATRESKK